MSIGETRECRICARPVILLLLVGWQHVSLFDNIECDDPS